MTDIDVNNIKRYWCSWWSAYHKDLGHTKPHFDHWVTGERDADNEVGSKVSICAMVDATSVQAICDAVAAYMPDYEVRFCHEVPDDAVPEPSRFPGYEGKVLLTGGTE